MTNLRRIFGKTAYKQNRRSKKRSRRGGLERKPLCESLETRRLLNADVGWVKPFGDADFDQVRDVAVDADNNTYAVARFSGSLDLDPDASYTDNRDLVSVPITAYGVVITKFAPDGRLLWSHVAEGQDGDLTGPQQATPRDIQIQDSSIYVSGTFYDLWDFDPTDVSTDSQREQLGTTLGSFVLKLDAETGDFQWVNGLGLSASANSGNDSMAVAPDGSLYFSFDLREGAQIGNEVVPAQASADWQGVAKIASDGTVLGYEQLLSSGDLTRASLELVTPTNDPNSWRLYLSGGLRGELSLNEELVANNPGDDRDAYLVKMTTDLQVEQVQQYDFPLNQSINSIAAGESGIYISGNLSIDASDNTGSSLSGDDFLFRVNTDGAILASQAFGDELSNVIIYSVETADDGVLVGGSFRDTVDFAGEVLTSLNGSTDGFVAKLTPQLNVITVKQYAGAGTDIVTDVALRSDGLVALGGSFEESAVIPDVGVITSIGEDDGFVAVVNFDETSGRNSSPIALDDQYVLANLQLEVSVEDGLLANDSDPDGDSVSFELLTPPSNGTLQLNQDGSFTFAPNPGFLGSDQFTYRLSDGDLTSEEATVSLEIVEELVLFEDSFEAGIWNGKWVEDSQNDWFRSTQRATDGSFAAEVDGYANLATLTVAQPLDLSGMEAATLSFDWLIERGFDSGEYLRLEFFDGSGWQTINSLNGNSDPENTWHSESIAVPSQYLVDDFRFRYSAKVSRSNEDGNVDDVRLVGLLKSDSNLPPEAADDAPTTSEDRTIAIDVLANDGDPDGDALTITSVTQPGSGTADTVGGQIQYTPNANFHGSDSFSYTIADTAGNQATATVDVAVSPVNDAPVANVESYSLDQDTTLNVGVPGVLSNDIDVDGEPLTAALVAGPTSGSLTLNVDGSFSYTPTAGFVGNDSFVYQAVDTSGVGSNEVPVSLQVDAVAAGPNLSHGVLGAVGSNWQTVSLGKSYTSMIVVATPRYNDGSGPGVVRIDNVTSNSFDVRVDNVGSSIFSGGVHYITVEEGVYDESGFKLEAVKYTEGQTSGRGNWQIDTSSQAYQQSYDNPVVVGQVMSANDPDWSVFWASSGSRTSPPTSGVLNVGKHVAEDPDTTRADETIGYLVIEATQDGTIEGLPFVAGVGGDTVRGVGNGTYQYSYDAMPNAKTAVLGSAGMDGGDGGWAVLRGNNPLPPAGGSIALSIDEDQLRDSERNHTTEQVAYFVIDPPLQQTANRIEVLSPIRRPANSVSIPTDDAKVDEAIRSLVDAPDKIQSFSVNKVFHGVSVTAKDPLPLTEDEVVLEDLALLDLIGFDRS
ncbi:MAG: Ig-like domain-containing protein [Planctomycetota bacterium]